MAGGLYSDWMRVAHQDDRICAQELSAAKWAMAATPHLSRRAGPVCRGRDVRAATSARRVSGRRGRSRSPRASGTARVDMPPHPLQISRTTANRCRREDYSRPIRSGTHVLSAGPTPQFPRRVEFPAGFERTERAVDWDEFIACAQTTTTIPLRGPSVQVHYGRNLGHTLL